MRRDFFHARYCSTACAILMCAQRSQINHIILSKRVNRGLHKQHRSSMLYFVLHQERR
jgi:dTDP-4-dehydrorhamnose 3,5-epimerase-like enzyme